MGQITDPGSVDERLAGVEVSAELGEVTTDGEDRATAEVNLTFSNVPEQAKEFFKDGPVDIPLEKDGDTWCISGPGGAGSAPGSGS